MNKPRIWWDGKYWQAWHPAYGWATGWFTWERAMRYIEAHYLGARSYQEACRYTNGEPRPWEVAA